MGANNKPTIDEEVHSELEDSVDDGKGYDDLVSQEDHEDVEDMEDDDYAEESIIQEDDLVNVVYEVLEARQVAERRPLPVFVKGREVDLVKLSVQVRALGGYDRVTTWSSISKSIGFGPEGGPLLKLVYVKYLKTLENRRLVAGPPGLVLDNGAINKDITQNIENHEHSIVPTSKSNSTVKVQGSSLMTRRSSNIEEEEKPSLGLPCSQPLVPPPIPPHESVISNESSTAIIFMLEWVKRLALNPGGPKKGHGSRGSRGNEALIEKYMTLSRKVRAVLCKNTEHIANPRSESPVQQLPKKRGAIGRAKEAQGLSSTKKSRQPSS